MRKSLLTISVLAFFAIGGKAQSGTFSYGVKVGPTLNWASRASTVCENKGAALGFGLGFVANYQFSDYVAVSTGLEFNQVTMKYRFADYRRINNFLEYATVSVGRKSRSSYLEVPLKARAQMEVFDDMTGYVEAGVGIGLNLATRAKDEFEFHGNSYADNAYVDVTRQYRPLQVALRFGIGVQYSLNADWSVFAQLSSRHAVSNMFTHEMLSQTGSNMKANFVGLEVGVVH